MRSANNRRILGFTLLEVLIALVVLAVGMLAVIGTAGTSTRLAGQLRDETLAHWVAMNELTTLRLGSSWPALGKLKGEADMGGQQWLWQAVVSTTADPDLLRVDINVSNKLTPDVVASSLTGFMGQPVAIAGPVNPAPPTTPGGGNL